MTREDPVAEAGGEALDLGLDALDVAIALGRPVHAVRRHVGVRPRGVTPLRGARRVGDALLAQQQRRSVRKALARLRDRRQELALAASDVHGARIPDRFVGPRNRPVERPVDLHRREAVDVALERAAVPAGESLSREPHQLVWHHVGDDHRRGHALAGRDLDARRPAAHGHDPLDRRTGAELAPEAAEVAHEGIGQALGAATGAGPADRVAEQVEIGAGDRAARLQDRRIAVHGGAVQPCARPPGLKQPPAEADRRGRQQPRERQCLHGTGVGEQAQRAVQGWKARQHRGAYGVERIEERGRERRPPVPVAGTLVVQAGRSGSKVPVQHGGARVGQRICRAGGGVHPLETMVTQRHPAEHR